MEEMGSPQPANTQAGNERGGSFSAVLTGSPTIISEKELIMTKKKKIIILAASLGTVVCLAAAGITYLVLGNKYKTEFFPNTLINGVDCSNMTVQQVEDKIQSSIENYSLTLHFLNDETQTLTGTDFGYTYISNGSVQELLEQQNVLLWLTESRSDHSYTIANSYSYDQEQLEAHLSSFPQLQEENMESPQDARVEYQDNQYTIVEEVSGTTLNPQTVSEAVKEAIANNDPELYLDEKDLYLKPAVLADDPGLLAQAEQLNQLANAHITYNLPDGSTAEVTPELLKSWLTQNSDGSYTRDEAAYEENLRAFIADLDSKTTSSGEEHLFDTTMDGTISVPYGELSTYTGYQLDTEGELAALKTHIDEHQVITRDPVYLSTGGGTGNHGVGDTYVELNLSRQHLWYYKDGELFFDTSIVSGTMTTWRYTPAGWYTLASKTSPHTMKGEIDPATGQPIYTAKCTYWMPFIPSVGIGFHDYAVRSDWRTTAYLTNGSHGCINMRPADAKTLYNSLEVGTPVIVYYSEPYSLTKELSPAEKYAQNPTKPTATATPAPTQTPKPTETPATPAPTQLPATPAPTQPPATPAPTQPPATPAPTQPPATPAPTQPPATPAPTQAPAAEDS